jgi:hypothetical protein
MKKFKDGDLIVGFRFYASLSDDGGDVKERIREIVRGGAGGSLVIDQMAASGPIYYWQPQPTPTNGRAKVLGWAVCRGCRRMSGGSGRGNRSDAVERWAHQHRCEPGKRLDEMPNHPCGPYGGNFV